MLSHLHVTGTGVCYLIQATQCLEDRRMLSYTNPEKCYLIQGGVGTEAFLARCRAGRAAREAADDRAVGLRAGADTAGLRLFRRSHRAAAA